MNQAHKDLSQQLSLLKEKFSSLGERLSQAGKELQAKGIPPSGNLIAELANYQTEFTQLHLQTLTALTPKAGEISALKDLELLVNQVTDAQNPPVNQISAPVKAPTPQSDIFIFGQPTSPDATPEVIILPRFDEPDPKSAVTGVSPGFTTTGLSTVGNSDVSLKILANIQSLGDREFKDNEMVGTRGQSLRLEGFQINIHPPVPGLSLRYQAHIQGIGDTAWLEEGKFAGTRNQERRIEGFSIQLTGPEASKYDVFYTAHIQNVGDYAVCSNGQYCGTRGQSLRIESLKVWIKRK